MREEGEGENDEKARENDALLIYVILSPPIWDQDESPSSHVQDAIELYTRRVVTFALRHIVPKRERRASNPSRAVFLFVSSQLQALSLCPL